MYSQNYSLNSQLKIWMITLLVMIVLIILVGGLTRLTDSGLSITTWELFVGTMPPLTSDKWIEYFDLYKTIPEFKEQNFNMTLNEFKIIFWWEWAHRQLGRLIGLTVFFPMIYFTIKNGFWILKEYSIIFFLVCFQGFIGWYMVSSGLVDRVDVSHYRLSLHLFIAFIILSLVFWKFLKLTNIRINQMVEQLADRLKNDKNDLEGWIKLYQSYKVLGKNEKALKAIRDAIKLNPQNINLKQILLRELLPTNKKPVFSKETNKLVNDILVLEPNNVDGLFFSGFAAYNKGEKKKAITYWDLLLKQLPTDSLMSKEINKRIILLHD